jgi:serine/threonine protein kinase
MAEEDRWIELSEGDEFAGYRIERLLGRGGMGVLYLAMEPGLERRVALKLIVPEAAADEVFARRFSEESRIAASIEHPNVVPIYAAGEEGEVPYIAMRYVAGSDLAKRVAREGRLEPAEAAALIAQVANGLDAIHAAGLVHRDVKPANVLLSGGEGAEHAYITDFGVARNVATNSGLTQTGRFVGTLDYVAPEQISGGEVDAQVDVYALGCLLYKLLTGEVPFPKDGEAARLYAHLNDPPPSPSLFVPRVSMALDDVVIRAMSKPPEDRYPSAGDLGRAALAAVSGEQVAIPERTVATGGAATRTAETIPPPEAPSGSTKPAATRETPTPTRKLPPERSRGRRWLALPAGLAAIVAIVAVAIALSGSGGGGQKASNGGGGGGGAKSAPVSLSKAQLIAKADAICARSQNTYREAHAKFPKGETTPDVAYSERLTEISQPAVRQLRALDPPPGIGAAYRAYVQAQERVKKFDQQALLAAEQGDEATYLKAREERNLQQSERHELAQAVGLKKCSAG